MVNQERARALATGLPEATESSHHGVSDFRVRNKIFATFPEPGHMLVRIEPGEQAALLAEDPGTYSAEGYWGRMGWTKVGLATVDEQQLRELLTDAWRRVAPKRIAGTFDAPERIAATFDAQGQPVARPAK